MISWKYFFHGLKSSKTQRSMKWELVFAGNQRLFIVIKELCTKFKQRVFFCTSKIWGHRNSEQHEKKRLMKKTGDFDRFGIICVPRNVSAFFLILENYSSLKYRYSICLLGIVVGTANMRFVFSSFSMIPTRCFVQDNKKNEPQFRGHIFVPFLFRHSPFSDP